MFGKRKKSKPNSDRCQKCGHFLVAPGQAWTTRADAQRWERPSGGWSQPPAIKAARTKSLTRIRLEQALALGVCSTACGIATQVPNAIGSVIFISSAAFVVSVVLGKDNQEAVFKLLDRNKDGRVSVDDIQRMFEDWRGDDEPEQEPGKPETVLRFLPVRGYGTVQNIPMYEPQIQEQTVDIPGMPRAKTDIWTVERVVNFLNAAITAGRWARAHCDELGVSQGQWVALRRWVQSFEKDESGNQVLKIWGTADPPTLQAFVDQLSVPVNQPTGSTNH